MFTMLGLPVEISPSMAGNVMTLDLSLLAPGLSMVRVYTEDAEGWRKVVKQ